VPPNFFFNKVQQVFRTQPEFSIMMNQVSNYTQALVKLQHAKVTQVCMNITEALQKICSPSTFLACWYYPHQRLPSEKTKTVPNDWESSDHSCTGWMTAEVFYKYIGNVTSPHLPKKYVKFPVISIINGHDTDPSYHRRTLLWNRHKLDLSSPTHRKTLPPTERCNFQTTANGLENSSARLA
jgi:hypothetical protein